MVRILDAFEKLLRKQAYEAITINDIASEAATGAGSIYARFDGKRSILLGVHARIFGTCFGISLAGAIFGPMAMALVFDRTGSYDTGLLLLPVMPVVAFALLWMAKPLGHDPAN